MSTLTQDHSKAVQRVVFLILLTAVLSLLYGIQYYLGGPLRLTVTSEVYDLALDTNDSLIAAAAQDGTVRLWEVPNRLSRTSSGSQTSTDREDWPMQELTGHDGSVIAAAFYSRSALVSVDQQGTIRLWDVSTALDAGESGGQAQEELETPGNAQLIDATVAADEPILVTLGQDGAIHVWDLTAADLLQSIEPNEGPQKAVALSPDGALVAADEDENVQIWNVGTGEPVQKLEGHWEDEEAQEEWLGHERPVTALAFSPDGELLVSGSADKTLVFWELESGQARWTGEGHFAGVTDLTFSEDGSTLLSGSADSKAKTWRVPGGKSSGTYVGHLSTVNAAIPGPEENTLISGANDGTIRLWDMINTSEIHVEWVQRGLLPMWGQLFSLWMLVSGVLGLVSVAGLWQLRGWSHLLALGLFIVGPVIVLGLPLLEALSYPFSGDTRLEIAWPLLLLVLWYGALVYLLTREPVSTPYEAPLSAPLSEQLMSTLRTRGLRQGLYIGAIWVLLLVALYSILRRFDLDVAFMGHFFSFIMEGAGYTVLVSAASIALAVILALLGALGRLSGNPIANGISGFYISLIRGTPLLVQIYIWYLGLPRLNIILSSLMAGILALGVNYGAYMTEIFRAGIQAIGKGQYEAAQALGMSRAQTLRRIVLPQAFRIVIPPIGNQFIAMMKDSSLVSVMGVWELTFRAAKIGRQYFRSMETFIIAAAFYWVLTVIFQYFQGKLETYMARGERR